MIRLIEEMPMYTERFAETFCVSGAVLLLY